MVRNRNPGHPLHGGGGSVAAPSAGGSHHARARDKKRGWFAFPAAGGSPGDPRESPLSAHRLLIFRWAGPPVILGKPGALSPPGSAGIVCGMVNEEDTEMTYTLPR